MSKLTYKIKHSFNFSKELEKAKLIANFGIINRTLSSKDVKQFGLKSILSNQILRKYVKNHKCKKVKSIKLTVPNQGIKYKDNVVYISCLKIRFDLYKTFEKINQIEIDNQYFYICCTVKDLPEFQETGYIGIDRNATGHLAVCALNNKIIKLGKSVTHNHKKYKDIRKKAQKLRKYKFIKTLANKEQKINKDINHKISRKIVDLAYRNQCAIKLENLKNITKKKSFSKKLNDIKSNWSFYQLAQFIEYKAKLLGIKVYYVNPYNTSQLCSKCGTIGIRDKKSFMCPNCGHNDHADANAAFNIAKAEILQNRLVKDRDLTKGISDNAQVEMSLKAI